MGAVLDAYGWEAVFWVTGAVLLVALVVAAATTRGAGVRHPARFDVPGAVVLATALAVLLVGITNGTSWGWGSVPVLGSVAAAALLVAWWVRWERRVPTRWSTWR